MFRDTECVACGLSIYDLPDLSGMDDEMKLDTMFERGEDRRLYCMGCLPA